MAHITVAETKAWLEPSKAGSVFNSLDQSLETQVTDQLFARLRETFDVSTWINETSTPALIRSIICMQYVAWVYERTFTSDAANEDVSAYAKMLRRYAQLNIDGLLNGSIELVEQPDVNDSSIPSFYPDDLSSDPRIGFSEDADPSATPIAFRMGQIF